VPLESAGGQVRYRRPSAMPGVSDSHDPKAKYSEIPRSEA
jgi:hypothetical protein